MSNRTVRVNELVQRELSEILRKRHQSEGAAITITGVQVSPDLHDGKIFLAVTGDDNFAQQKLRWFRDVLPQLKQELGRRIVLKWMPAFVVVLDESTARGNRLLQIMDEISAKENSATDQKSE